MAAKSTTKDNNLVSSHYFKKQYIMQGQESINKKDKLDNFSYFLFKYNNLSKMFNLRT